MTRQSSIDHIAEVIAYIETHLNERLDLGLVADGVHYSKYYLHRMFTGTVGMTPHDYVRRRRLTEAARLLADSRRPILEIALEAGYESQQAFAGVFRTMYKRTPLEYRKKECFYPLQLPLLLHPEPSAPGRTDFQVRYALEEDIPDWMDFVPQVIDGFPCYDEAEHRRRLQGYVKHRQALIVRDRELLVGAAACSGQSGRIDFLGVHPQYRRYGVGEALLAFLQRTLSGVQRISITTYREGDRADTGQRAYYQRLGFTEAELLTEYGYPTQRLILKSGQEGTDHE